MKFIDCDCLRHGRGTGAAWRPACPTQVPQASDLPGFPLDRTISIAAGRASGSSTLGKKGGNIRCIAKPRRIKSHPWPRPRIAADAFLFRHSDNGARRFRRTRFTTCGRGESNPRQLDYNSSALPSELHLVSMTGFEPASPNPKSGAHPLSYIDGEILECPQSDTHKAYYKRQARRTGIQNPCHRTHEPSKRTKRIRPDHPILGAGKLEMSRSLLKM